MYCYKCGAQCPDDSGYCVRCGTVIGQSQPDCAITVPPDDALAAREPSAEVFLSAQVPPAVPAKKKRIKFLTRVAYNILISEQKYRNVFLVVAIMLVCGLIAAFLCTGLVQSITDAVNLSELAKSNPVKALQNEAASAWQSLWGRILWIGVTLFFTLLPLNILIKINKISGALKQKDGRAAGSQK